ncbi:MAG: hypothetical protein OEZ16_02475 [Chromatiales bacterium]|nr:hypothetical protein [Chromatiales bacterium]
MNYTALSLSQTPPLSVPLRFFLTAPLFLAAAALLLLINADALTVGRWSPTMLALTHLVTLGFLGMVMVGAIQQLLPVLIGVPLTYPRLTSTLLHLLMAAGILLLVTGMALTSLFLLQLGSALLLPALLGFILLVWYTLWRSPSTHATVGAMALALFALLVLGGIALWVMLQGGWHLPLAHPLTRLHIGWGGLGWIGALLIGVSYQVVPMFQITPEYPLRVRRWLTLLLAGVLLLWSASALFIPSVTWLAEFALAGLVLLFAVQTLWLQQQRKRRLADVTFDFWRLAMGSLILAVVTWLLGQWFNWPQLGLVTGVLFLLGFATSAINGMLYKIVPFLVWLHLNNRVQSSGGWQGSIPNMKQIIPVVATRRQYQLHSAALLLLLLAVGVEIVPVVRIAAGLWLISALYLGWNLLQGMRCYQHYLRQVGQG